MFNLKQQPYNLLLCSALAILIASLFTSDDTIDVHLHDTYFIISVAYFLRATSVLLLIFWTLYILINHFLFSKTLMWVHIISTTVTAVFLVGISFYSNHHYKGLAGMPRRYYDYGSWDTVMMYNNLTKAVLATLLLMGVGLFAFIVNLIIGLFKTFSAGVNSK